MELTVHVHNQVLFFQGRYSVSSLFENRKHVKSLLRLLHYFYFLGCEFSHLLVLIIISWQQISMQEFPFILNNFPLHNANCHDQLMMPWWFHGSFSPII